MARTKNKKGKSLKTIVSKKPAHKISDEVIIDVKDVYKSFRVYYDKGSMLKEQFINPGRSRYEEREVLKGISFRVHRGETVALIGQNGCGKSTTLKMLTKILYPNKGTVTINGKVSSLIELGAGFHPDMSGRENIYINASILGIKREEVDKRIDEIIRFSELEEFIDNPIRTYSSGMYMRLAFSVAINVDADILLIDEILAVGDQAFQDKCIAKMEELRASGVTVVLVSHSMGQVQDIADRCIWIADGRIVEDGDTKTVCAHYEEAMTARREERDLQEARERAEAANMIPKAADVDPQTTVDIVSNDSMADDNVVSEKNVKLERARDRERRQREREELKKARQEDFSRRWQGGGSEGIPLLGTLGILLMLLCHAAQDIYGIGYADMQELTLKMKIAGYTLFSTGRIGIPVLLMLLGFVGLSQDYSTRGKRVRYWTHTFLPMLGVWELWVLIYEFFLYIWSGRSIDVITWVKHALLIEFPDMSHAWFARMFLLMMLVMPILANALQQIRAGLFRFVMILVWIFIFLFPGLDLYGQMNGGTQSIPDMPGTLCYLFYLCLGYLMSLYTRRLLRGSREIIILVSVLIATVVSQILMDNKGIHYLIWYTFFGVSIMSLYGFDLAVRLQLDRIGGWIKRIPETVCMCSIGVYLVHRPVQMALMRWLMGNGRGFLGGAGGDFAVRTVILWIISVVVSIVLVWSVSKIPIVGRVVTGQVGLIIDRSEGMERE